MLNGQGDILKFDSFVHKYGSVGTRKEYDGVIMALLFNLIKASLSFCSLVPVLQKAVNCNYNLHDGRCNNKVIRAALAILYYKQL